MNTINRAHLPHGPLTPALAREAVSLGYAGRLSDGRTVGPVCSQCDGFGRLRAGIQGNYCSWCDHGRDWCDEVDRLAAQEG